MPFVVTCKKQNWVDECKINGKCRTKSWWDCKYKSFATSFKHMYKRTTDVHGVHTEVTRERNTGNAFGVHVINYYIIYGSSQFLNADGLMTISELNNEIHSGL